LISLLFLNGSEIGYREGITAGKENALQEGFDEGFATIGVPLGRQLGILRGTVNALLASLQLAKPLVFLGNLQIEDIREPIVKDLQMLSQRLGNIRLKDIAPRDLQAEAHAREHRDVESEGTDDALANAIMQLETSDRPNGTQELATIQQEIYIIMRRLGVNLTL
jgi:Essential protein Yae1, N terminal